MIDASQSMITMNSEGELVRISSPQKRHLELHIRTLQNAPRNQDTLEQILKAKRRQKEELGKGLRIVYTSPDTIVFFLVQVSHGAAVTYS